MASIELQVITVQGARRVNSGVASSFLYPFPRRPPRHFLYLRSFCLRHPLFPRFCSLSLFLSLARFHPLWPPSAAFLADKLDSIIANHDGRDDSHVADRPASWQRKGEVEMSPSFGSTSRWSVTVARSLTPRRVQHEKKSISWILLSLPMCAATSVGIHSSELITAPAARRIVITLPTPCTPPRLSSFFPPNRQTSSPNARTGHSLSRYCLVRGTAQKRKLFFSGCWNIRFVVKSVSK